MAITASNFKSFRNPKEGLFTMRRTIWRGALALLAAIGLGVFLLATTAQPHLTRVVVVTHLVAAGDPVTGTDLGWLTITGQAPSGVLTATPAPGELAQAPLYPGETLTASLLARTYAGLPRGRVRVVVPVSAAQSALAQVGSRVDVMASLHQSNGPTLIETAATRVPVVGVYNATGGAVVTSGTGAAAPGLVALAVTPTQLGNLMPLLTAASGSGTAYWLVFDPQAVVSAPIQAPASGTSGPSVPSTASAPAAAASGSTTGTSAPSSH